MPEKIAFLLPGYPETKNKGNYQEVSSIYSEEGFKVEPLDIQWSKNFYKIIEKTEGLIESKLEKYDNPEIHFFGHSWGAAILLTLSPKFNPETQILAGLSPEFREDNQTFSKLQEKIGYLVEKVAGLFYEIPEEVDQRPSLHETRNQIDSDIYLFYGEREHEGFLGIKYFGMKGELTKQRKRILEAEERIVKNSNHHMESDEYLEEIERIISKI